jgi:hypothetical protein
MLTVNRSLTMGRALLAIIFMSTAMPGAARSMAPLPLMLPGPALPLKRVTTRRAPSALMLAAMAWTWMPRA